MHPTARIPLFVPDPPFLTKPDRAQSYTCEIVLNLIHVTCYTLTHFMLLVAWDTLTEVKHVPKPLANIYIAWP